MKSTTYQSLTYADESHVVPAEDQTQDGSTESGFSLQKLVSTTGQPLPAIKLGGAEVPKCTVYRC